MADNGMQDEHERQRQIFETVFETVPAGIAVLQGTEHRYWLVNPAYLPFVAGKGEILGRTVADVFPEVADTVIPLLDHVFRSGEIYRAVDMPLTLRRNRQLEEVYITFNYIPWCDTREVIQGVLVLAMETTEQVRARQQAEQERASLRTVLETLPIGVIILDAAQRILATNSHVEPIYSGIVPLSQPLQEYRRGNAWWSESGQPVDEDDWPSAQAIKQGKVVGGDIDILRADGVRATIYDAAAPLRDSQGQIIGAVVVVQDITDRKHAEAELRGVNETLEQRVAERTQQVTEALEREQNARREAESARSYFEGLLEAAPDSIVIVDPEGRIVLVNSQLELLSGYTREELFGQPVETLIPARYHAVHVGHRHGYITEPRARPMGVGLELFLRQKDGSEVPVEISLSPVRTPAGLLVTASIRDITARKEAEAEIKRLNDDLQRNVEQLKTAIAELEAFSYSVSHDLRAPLRSIDGFSKLLLERYPEQLDERGKDYLSRVRAAAQRMGRLIDDMLNLSRIGRVEMRHETVNLSKLAEDILSNLREQEPGRQVETVIQPGMTATGDSALLQIVLENLLGNAWKFTGKREQARIEMGIQEIDGERVYYVRDNGAGFSTKYTDKLFSPFQRLHTEEEFPGTGIGLAIVRRIINRHGGRVWAEGAEDKGATFYFTLGEPG